MKSSGLQCPGMEVNNFEVITGSFRWLSYDAYPIYTDRIGAIDNGINLSGGLASLDQVVLYDSFPGISCRDGVTIIYRRQRK